MTDLEFYNHGIHNVRGKKRAIVPLRRLLERVLRPWLQAQVSLYRELFQRDDHLSRRVDVLEKQEIDVLALSRRLAAIEDRLFAPGADLPAPGRHNGHRVPPAPHGPAEPKARPAAAPAREAEALARLTDRDFMD